MLDPTTRDVLEPVIRLLDTCGIDYYIGGSLASMAYGEPRTTMDVDLVAALKESDAATIHSELREDFYIDVGQIRDAIQRRSCFNLVSLSTSFKVDIFVRQERPYSLNEFTRRVRIKVGADPDLFGWFASAENILLNKLEWYRLGGETSDRQWRDVVGILKVQLDSLEQAYLSEWARELGVADLLERAKTDAGLIS